MTESPRSPVTRRDVAYIVALTIGLDYRYKGISSSAYEDRVSERVGLLSGDELAWFLDNETIEDEAQLKYEVALALNSPRDLALDMAVSAFIKACYRVMAAKLRQFDAFKRRIDQLDAPK